MDTVRSWILAFRAFSRERKLNCLIALVLALLLIVSIFAVTGQIRAVHARNETRAQLGESLYYDLYMFTQTYDMMDVPNANIQDVVLPQMRRYYYYACALNDALQTSYGSRYGALNGDDTSAIDAAFTAFENAYRQDQPDDSARQSMGGVVAQMRQRLQQRFPNGRLKPAR